MWFVQSSNEINNERLYKEAQDKMRKLQSKALLSGVQPQVQQKLQDKQLACPKDTSRTPLNYKHRVQSTICYNL
jgi:hypothetical protein